MKSATIKHPRTAARKTQRGVVSFNKLDRAAEIAYYYGFTPIETPRIERDDFTFARKMMDSDTIDRNYGPEEDFHLYVSAEEKAALLRLCHQRGLLNPLQPTMVYYEGTPKRFDGHSRANPAIKRYNLEIIGTSKSVAEAELIKAALEILREEGFEDLYVDVNSIGDKDSTIKFVRDLSAYYRKNIGVLESHCRQNLKRDVFMLAECTDEKCRRHAENAPKSVSFLSEPSRIHFKEVLEFLESMNIPYKIDPHLLGSRRVCNHTIFLIRTLGDGKPENIERSLAFGFRYGGFARRLDMKKDIPAVGLTITFRKERGAAVKKGHNPQKPKVYFIQFSADAKRKSLELIEVLRHAKIPVHQALSKDKLSSQIAAAEGMGIPFVLIMGQREALESSVIVRDMATRFQETIKIEVLADYLKKRKFTK